MWHFWFRYPMKRQTSTPSSNLSNGRFEKKYKSYKYFYKIKHSLFNQQIWVGIGVSIVCVIVVLSLIERYLEYQTTGPLTNDGGGLRIITKTITGKQYLYVFGNLLSQGLNWDRLNIETKFTGHELFVINRRMLSIASFAFPTCRWCLEPGRFLFCPGLHFASLHLRCDANQSSAN